MPIQQIDYETSRILVSDNGKHKVRITKTRLTRYQFSGIILETSHENSELYKEGEERKDWNKRSFPLPWTNSPEVVTPTTPKPEDTY